ALQLGGDSIYGQYFEGMIDNVRVYNTALTQAQIQADMTTPVGSPTPAPTPTPTPAPTPTPTPSPTWVLTANQSISSPDGQYQLVMQGDGNLVEYGPGGQVIWDAATNGNSGAYATMQGDGNLVVYSAAGTPLWNSGTWGHAGAYFQLQDNGNAVIDQAHTTALPSRNSTAAPR